MAARKQQPFAVLNELLSDAGIISRPKAKAVRAKAMAVETREEVRVVMLHEASDASIVKGYDKRYHYEVSLELEDGRVFEWAFSKRLLRDVKAELATLPKVPEHEMVVGFENGQPTHTTTSFWIGGAR